MKILRILIVNLMVAISITEAAEHVILLHGLCRTTKSMTRMEQSLTSSGYNVLNFGYPSRHQSIQELSDKFVKQAVQQCQNNLAEKIHFVTHSMGGILVRDYLSRHHIPNMGRVVMLSPPSQGSEIVDKLGGLSLFGWLNGPAGRQLGTKKDSLPNQLGPVRFPLGVIAGDRTINWINSVLIPGPDDGKVSINSTLTEGMNDHIVLHATHAFIMKNRKAIRHTISFLESGSFN